MRIVGSRVIGHMGDVLAEKIYGKWESKDPTILDFISKNENPAPKSSKKPKVVVEEELVRARDENGQFVADDPATPDVDEAWTTKLVKKVKKK